MAPFLFPYPTTGSVTFANVLLDRGSAYTFQLADATVARTKLQLVLKAAAAGDQGTSALAVLEAVQVYLPYLRGIIACLDTDDLLFKGDPVFLWASSLTRYTVSSPLLPFPSIHAEHHFVLLVYTIALCNYAASILSSLPTFESTGRGVPALSTEDEKKTTAALTRAVDLLSQASGVAEWAATNVAPQLEEGRKATGGRVGKGTKWPVETGPEGFRGLSMILLADAHVTAIRKLLLPVLGHALFAPPGPPLPSNHPSPSLLGKLYLHVANLYSQASALFAVHDGPTAKAKLFARDRLPADPDAAESDVIPDFKRYLRKEALVSSALAYKWLGVDVGENGKGNNVGEAIAWISEARGRLAQLEDSKVEAKMKGLGIGRGAERRKEARKVRQGRIEREIADADAWISSYKKMNDTVAFQAVPPAASLVAPPGRPIFSAKAFSPPDAKLTPVVRDGGEPEPRDDPSSLREADYAGKGNYF
ncbi:hypothetical protein CspeluHIS016_0101920 [Cutaneotrichosporon spelunceum]|uniref:pH-response regulator protein palC n=1 Tax=Cutaneotrichosporon spelunceum TaxID=1672016 RepID=A0AAD3TMA5_9TREE|nr:hypothetical protein CspeluHIS016_0101920 [Cutaneotrichosporon spelunceum]